MEVEPRIQEHSSFLLCGATQVFPPRLAANPAACLKVSVLPERSWWFASTVERITSQMVGGRGEHQVYLHTVIACH